jgi:hypothetical protein
LAQGTAAFLAGDWRRAKEFCLATEQILRDSCTHVVWEVSTARTFLHGAQFYLGEVEEMARRIPTLLEEADVRGDRLSAATLRTGDSVLVWLAQDNPEEAERQVESAMASWPAETFHVQHFLALMARTYTALYRGHAGASLESMKKAWPALRGSELQKVQFIRIATTHARARSEIAAAVESKKDAASLLTKAEQDIQRVETESMRWSQPLAELARAGVASVRKHPKKEAAALERAIHGFERIGMALHAAVARYRLGQITGGDAGRALIDAANAFMIGQAIRNPARIVTMLAPGRDA